MFVHFVAYSLKYTLQQVFCPFSLFPKWTCVIFDITLLSASDHNSSAQCPWGGGVEGGINALPDSLEITRPITLVFRLADSGQYRTVVGSGDWSAIWAATHLWPTMWQETFTSCCCIWGVVLWCVFSIDIRCFQKLSYILTSVLLFCIISVLISKICLFL